MANLKICAPCRLRLLLERHQNPRQAHNPFTTTSRPRDLDTFGRRIQNAFHDGDNQAFSTEDELPRASGRYSRGLRPEVLLEELKVDASSRAQKQTGSEQRTSRKKRRTDVELRNNPFPKPYKPFGPEQRTVWKKVSPDEELKIDTSFQPYKPARFQENKTRTGTREKVREMLKELPHLSGASRLNPRYGIILQELETLVLREPYAARGSITRSLRYSEALKAACRKYAAASASLWEPKNTQELHPDQPNYPPPSRVFSLLKLLDIPTYVFLSEILGKLISRLMQDLSHAQPEVFRELLKIWSLGLGVPKLPPMTGSLDVDKPNTSNKPRDWIKALIAEVTPDATSSKRADLDLTLIAMLHRKDPAPSHFSPDYASLFLTTSYVLQNPTSFGLSLGDFEASEFVHIQQFGEELLKCTEIGKFPGRIYNLVYREPRPGDVIDAAAIEQYKSLCVHFGLSPAMVTSSQKYTANHEQDGVSIHRMEQDFNGSPAQNTAIEQDKVLSTDSATDPARTFLSSSRLPQIRRDSSMDPVKTSPPRSRPPVTHRDHGSKVEFHNEQMLTRLARAVEESKASQVFSIMKGVLQNPSPAALAEISDKVFLHMIFSLFAVRAPKEALQVYHFYLKLGRAHTPELYATLLQGAQRIRDVNGAEAIWEMMQKAKIQPNRSAYGIRASSLILAGNFNNALQVMSEMGSGWIRAAERKCLMEMSPTKVGKTGVPPTPPKPSELVSMFDGDIQGVPRPNVPFMNGMVSTLVRKPEGRSFIPKVLNWGHAFGLKPDVVTYNSLLHLAFVTEDQNEAMGILQRMEQEGIAFDGNTWTVLVNVMMRGFTLSELSPEDLQAKVLEKLDSIEKVTPNGIDGKVYAIVIDRFLKQLDNPAAAQVVLDRMMARGVMPGTHIYTMLAARLFEEKPQPNFSAIDALITHIDAQEGGRGAKLDEVFYDRMIENYAKFHRIVGLQPAYNFLRRIAMTNRNPSWPALIAVARALAERADWDRLNTFVEEILEREAKAGIAGLHIGQNEYYRPDFFRLISETVAMGSGLDLQLLDKAFRKEHLSN